MRHSLKCFDGKYWVDIHKVDTIYPDANGIVCIGLAMGKTLTIPYPDKETAEKKVAEFMEELQRDSERGA